MRLFSGSMPVGKSRHQTQSRLRPTALPSGVRMVSDLPAKGPFILGAMPHSGRSPEIWEVRLGRSETFRTPDGEAEAQAAQVPQAQTICPTRSYSCASVISTFTIWPSTGTNPSGASLIKTQPSISGAWVSMRPCQSSSLSFDSPSNIT